MLTLLGAGSAQASPIPANAVLDTGLDAITDTDGEVITDTDS